jgi:hypothetical protein
LIDRLPLLDPRRFSHRPHSDKLFSERRGLFPQSGLGRLGGFCLRFIWLLIGIPGAGLGELTFLSGWRNESLGAYIAFTPLRFVP